MFLFFVGKVGFSVVFVIIFLYLVEFFLIVIRNLVLGVVNFCVCIGGMIVLYVVDLVFFLLSFCILILLIIFLFCMFDIIYYVYDVCIDIYLKY